MAQYFIELQVGHGCVDENFPFDDPRQIARAGVEIVQLYCDMIAPPYTVGTDDEAALLLLRIARAKGLQSHG
jgi:hypothetical protein